MSSRMPRAMIPVANLRARARIVDATRRFFAARDYIEVDTPVAVPSPGLDLHLDAARTDLVSEPRWLITSPEYQMKRLVVAGLSRIFQIAKCFRRGEHGSNHQPEFSMLEFYRVGEPAEMLRDTEELVATLAREVTGSAFVTTPDGRQVDVSTPWRRITVREAFRRYAEVDCMTLDDARFFELLVDKVEPQLGRERAEILHAYPAHMASLARLSPDDPTVADRYEMYVGGIELGNGFAELTDASEQRTRFVRDQDARRATGRPVYPLDERFLGALAEGLPDCAGNAIGFDRLVMLLLGAESIADVTAFPIERL